MVFTSSEELERILMDLWGRIKSDPSMSGELVRSKLIVQFRYREPEGCLTVDGSDGQELKLVWGQYDKKPTIEMSMKADVAHEFWMGRVSVPVAVLTGKMVSKGPTPKALALLPVIRPAFNIYPEVLKQAGKEALLASG